MCRENGPNSDMQLHPMHNFWLVVRLQSARLWTLHKGVFSGGHMQRREVIAALAATAMVWPFAARAQQATPVIGLLSSASSRDYAPMIAAFRKSLGEAGFVEGQNVK